jgi:tetratricopeptide (TPR) repeat protein
LIQSEREQLRNDILELFRDVDAQLTRLSTLKEQIKELAQRWKSSQPAAIDASMEPRLSGTQPAVHADHLTATSFIEKGWSLIALGDHEGAERELRHALQLAPDDAPAESLLGWALMHQEKYDDALLSFQRVLMREPGNALARVNLGYICLKRGIFGEAIEHLSRAMRLSNDKKATLYAHFYLGLVYFEREMFEDAAAFFKKAITLGPNLIEAYYQLGRAHWFGGDRESATRTWREGAAANKFNPWGKRCAEIIGFVEGGGEPSRME